MSQLSPSLQSRFTLIIALLVVSIVFVACSSPTDSITVEPTTPPIQAESVLTARPPVGLEPTATVPAPTYREPSAPITLDNVAEIDYLGRLDVAGVKSTIFRWAVSPDGIQLVALNNDLLTEWNLVTGETNFSTPRNDITDVLYSSDRNEIYAIATDGTTSIFESLTGDPQTQVSLHPTYNGIYDYDVTTGLLAVAGEDGTVKVWDMAERLSLVTFDTESEVLIDIELSSDANLLATTDPEGFIKLWAWEGETKITEYDLQEAVAQSMVFAPDDTQLAVATRDFVAMWDILTGDLDFVLQSGTNSANEVLEFSPNGEYLITAGESGNLRMWNAESSDLEIELADVSGSRVSAVFSLDTSLLVTTILGQDAALWNIAGITGETVQRAPLSVTSQNLFGVEWSPDGFTLLFFDATGEIYVWGIPAR